MQHGHGLANATRSTAVQQQLLLLAALLLLVVALLLLVLRQRQQLLLLLPLSPVSHLQTGTSSDTDTTPHQDHSCLHMCCVL